MLTPEKEEDRLDEKVKNDSKLDLAEVVSIFDNFSILHPLKIICDWLSVNDDIVESNLNSPFWSRLVYLCNLLKVQELLNLKKDVSNDAKNILNENQWMQCFSLWEDRYLRRVIFFLNDTELLRLLHYQIRQIIAQSKRLDEYTSGKPKKNSPPTQF